MNFLLLSLLGLATGQAAPANLDFHQGTLEGWEGEGFALVRDADGSYAVTSADEKSPKRKGMIRHLLTVPPGAGKVRFQAYAACADGTEIDHRLDVILAGANQRVIPKTVRTGAGWRPASKLLSKWEGKPRDYTWDIADLAGKRLQIVILDQDDRPGSYVWCGGFHFEPLEEAQDNDFSQYMVELCNKHKLAPVSRFDSKRFTAYSNASESFTALRLRQCEVFYDLFYNHFYSQGFAMRHPRQRLMLAVFDSPDGVDAYLGMKLPSGVTGMYHPGTNRLLLYDLSENRYLVAQKKMALEKANKIAKETQRTRYIDAVERHMDVMVKDVNLTTTMHEAAHQLSFNCGLLNRQGDIAIWLAEGLACYCEATESAEWQAIGAPNTARIRDLARANGKYIPLQILVKEDWRNGQPILLGYAQSWALFRMLLQDQPKAMKTYLAQIHARRTPEYRMDDFRQAFGTDLAALEQRYFAYLRKLAQTHK